MTELRPKYNRRWRPSKAVVQRLLLSGKTINEICEELGVPRVTFWRWRKQMNIDMNETQNITRDVLVELRKAGWTWETIARSFGITKRRILQIRREIEEREKCIIL